MPFFFRNDDLGWQPEKFQRLLNLFKRYKMPLNAAAIPVSCQENYRPGSFSKDNDVLQVHVHGYSHLDHETEGKKCEFGSQRHNESVSRDLVIGYEIISTLFANNFFAAFTPPWNRMDPQFLPLLKEARFKVLSRDQSSASTPSGLKDLNVHLDLHTNKKPRPQGAEEIIQWLERKLTQQTAPVGIMLHHCHMHEADFEELDQLLAKMGEQGLQSRFMSEVAS